MKVLKRLFIGLFLIITFVIVFVIIVRNFFTTVYSRSDGFSGESILIYFDGLYSYNFYSDIGSIHHQFGYITKDSDRYILHNFPFYESQFDYFPRKYYKIQWNNLDFLIEENNIPFFCNAVNAGNFKKDKALIPFLIHSESENINFVGIPQMPTKFAKWIFTYPIYAEVVEKYRDNFSIKIDKGAKDSLFVGCVFYHNVDFGSIYTLVELSDSNAILQDQMTLEMSKNGNIDEPIKSIENEGKYLPSIRDRYESLLIGDTISTVNK